jgi:transcription initiation factor TFIIB
MNFEYLFEHLDTYEKPKCSDTCCNQSENERVINDVTVCNLCGNVVSNIIDTPEWRFYGADDTKSTDPTRCGMPVNILLPDSSVGSVISKQYSKDPNMFQVKRYQEWTSMTYKERSVYKIFNELTTICKKNNIPSKIETEAKSLYKIITTTKITRGNNRKGIIASCLYFACKNCNVARSQKEIAKMFYIKIPVMTKGCKLFQEIIQLSNKKTRCSESKSIVPDDFIDRFCNRLDLSEKQTNDIKSFHKKFKIISDVRPDSYACGLIMLYGKLNDIDITKCKLSDISNISEVTINKCYKKIEEIFKHIY